MALKRPKPVAMRAALGTTPLTRLTIISQTVQADNSGFRRGGGMGQIIV